MTEITFNQAREFLENINDKDKVAVIHHDDGDGFCSGILYYDWCQQKNATVEQFVYSIGKSSLEKFNLESFNKIIVCDLAPDFMSEQFESVKEKQVLYADHHPRETSIPKEILELVTANEGYIPSSRTAGELTNLKPWLALAGTITDGGNLYAENDNFIKNHLKEIDMSLDDFKENIANVITNFLIYFNKRMMEAFEILKKIKSLGEVKSLKQYSEPIENEIQKFVEGYDEKREKLGDINFYYFEPQFSIKSAVANIISRGHNDETYIFASPKNGTNKVTLSARTQDRDKNVASILKAGIDKLEEAKAGGHQGAAGGMILEKDLEKFKNNIRQFL